MSLGLCITGFVLVVKEPTLAVPGTGELVGYNIKIFIKKTKKQNEFTIF